MCALVQVSFRKRAISSKTPLREMTYEHEAFYPSQNILQRNAVCSRCVESLIFLGHFSQNDALISGSFAEETFNLRNPVLLRHPVFILRGHGVWNDFSERETFQNFSEREQAGEIARERDTHT